MLKTIFLVGEGINCFLALRLVELLNLMEVNGRIISAVIVLPEAELKKEKERTVSVTGFPSEFNPKDLLKWINSIGNIERYWLESNAKGYSLCLVMDSAKSCQDFVELINCYPFMNRILSASRKAIYNCYIKNIPSTWDENKLRKYCGAFGTIKSCHLRETRVALTAFVEFSSIKERDRAISCNDDAEKVETEEVVHDRIRRNSRSKSTILWER